MLEYISPNKPIDSIARWHEIELGLKMYFEWDLEIYRSVHKSWHSNCILKRLECIDKYCPRGIAKIINYISTFKYTYEVYYTMVILIYKNWTYTDEWMSLSINFYIFVCLFHIIEWRPNLAMKTKLLFPSEKKPMGIIRTCLSKWEKLSCVRASRFNETSFWYTPYHYFSWCIIYNLMVLYLF